VLPCCAFHRRWELPPQAALGPTATARPHIPFEGRTTASEAYTPKALPAYPGPQAGAGLEYKPMTDCRDFSTEARDTLTWKQPPDVCPAALLPPAPPTHQGAHVMWVRGRPSSRCTPRSRCCRSVQHRLHSRSVACVLLSCGPMHGVFVGYAFRTRFWSVDGPTDPFLVRRACFWGFFSGVILQDPIKRRWLHNHH
jgi:hypothetical protein